MDQSAATGQAVRKYPAPGLRFLIVLSVMAGAMMNQIDTTIANVALPHMQGSTSASREQITWVLTSYIVAAAIATPLTGWLASKIGRKRLLLISVVGFTAASGLCGISANLDQLIAFRLLQGLFGSALIPMAQATLLDIYPPEEHGQAMALFGVTAIAGPLLGPVLGGFLTEQFSWHWVFLVNLPIGVLTFLGLSAFMEESRDESVQRFDMLGFALLALSIGALQLMLDRGQMLDWFESWEIWFEAILAATAFYLLIVHAATSPHSFVRLAVFTDRNFVIATLIGFFLGVLLFGVMAMIPALLSQLMGYPIMLIGLISAPRGFGTLLATLFVGQAIKWLDSRILIMMGMFACALSSWYMSRLSLTADEDLVIISGIFQGMGSTLVFVPLSAMAFSTLAEKYRNEAVAMNTLIRNLGGAIGIALLQAITIQNTAAVQSRLTETVTPDNPIIGWAMPEIDFSLPETFSWLESEIVRQAMMVAYIDSFWALFVLAMIAAPLVLFLRMPRGRQPEAKVWEAGE